MARLVAWQAVVRKASWMTRQAAHLLGWRAVWERLAAQLLAWLAAYRVGWWATWCKLWWCLEVARQQRRREKLKNLWRVGVCA